MKLTHLDENGAAHMVNIGAKPVTQREAVAQSVLTMQPETLRMILDGTAPKGDVFACARIAGIMAAKRTAELIPMCHPIPIESVDIAIEAVSETQVRVVSTLRCSHKTGIEMEALTAASVAALTIYDMCKAVDRGMRIDETLLLHKTGEDTYLVDAGMDLEEFCEHFHVKTDSEMVSVSGWVMEQLGRVPVEGDHFVYETLDVTVTRVEHQRILEIRVFVLPKSESET